MTYNSERVSFNAPIPTMLLDKCLIYHMDQRRESFLMLQDVGFRRPLVQMSLMKY